MWSQHDQAHPYSDVGNVFIKNLDRNINNKDIYDTFAPFGSIISCKVAQDGNGISKGYGFVHFQTEEAANKSIENMNGMSINGRKVYVGRYIPHTEREKELRERPRAYTKVYVENFGENMSEEELCSMFDMYGRITNCKIMSDEDGRSKGFGFVAFEDPEAAERAVADLNGREVVEDKVLYVGLLRRFERLQIEGANLYVKNLDAIVDDVRLKQEFALFGTVVSAKVMMEEGRSRGFGFVCFSTAEEANRAREEMNGRIVGSKPLYVDLHQRKEERRASYFNSQYVPRMPAVRAHQMRPVVQAGAASGGYFVPSIPRPQTFYGAPQMGQMRTAQRWPARNPLGPAPQAGTNVYADMQYAYRSFQRPRNQAEPMRGSVYMPRPQGLQCGMLKDNESSDAEAHHTKEAATARITK